MKFFKWFKKKEVISRDNHHDLIAIYQELNHQYFKGNLDIPIGWFGTWQPRARRKVLLGSYHLDKKSIKINRVLDHPHVPRYYVAFIIYHEMLHHLYPPIVDRKRRYIHHVEFKRMERRFHEYEKALDYGKNHRHLWFQ